jgi:2-keto-4-pentenoate hydratase/2-oxohepta-3-ene-1,7-dioic acid hydratase in catechol pathway
MRPLYNCPGAAWHTRTRDNADRAAGWERRAPQGCPGGTTSGRAGGGSTRQLSDAWYRLPNPSATNDLDDELELGVVISKEGRNMREVEWLDDVAGFTIFNA